MSCQALRFTAALLFALSSHVAQASSYTVQWQDLEGHAGPVGDAVQVRLDFNDSGAWTATWRADAAHPFSGHARFNLNLFDTALGNLSNAHAPQLSLDLIHDFGNTSATEFSYSGQSAYLANWHAGDMVSTGNGSNFISGLVNMDNPTARDNLLAEARIVSRLPEPSSVLLTSMSLAAMGFTATSAALLRRRRAQEQAEKQAEALTLSPAAT